MKVREVADTRIVIALIALIDQLHTSTEIGAPTDGQSPHEALRSVPIATSQSRCHPSVDPLDASHSWPGILRYLARILAYPTSYFKPPQSLVLINQIEFLGGTSSSSDQLNWIFLFMKYTLSRRLYIIAWCHGTGPSELGTEIGYFFFISFFIWVRPSHLLLMSLSIGIINPISEVIG